MVNGTTRAQLILIGALLLATVIFGLSLLLNSLLFSGAASSGGANAAIGQTQTLEFEVQQSVRSVGLRVNHARRNVTAGQLGPAFAANVSAFSRLYDESKAAAGSATVTVRYDNASSTLGYRIVQTHDAHFTDQTADPSWTLVPDSSQTAVGWFTANVAIGNTSTGQPFVVTAENASAELTLQLTADGGNLSVESELDGPAGLATSDVTCGATSGRALVDLYDGSAYTGDCEFDGLGALEGPIGVEFDHADRVEGRYSLVLNRSNGNFGTEYLTCVDGGTGRPPGDADPCYAPVIWSANLTTVVQTDRVSYENAYNLTIYRGAS